MANVAFERFFPVAVGIHRRVAVLIHVHACQIQLIGAVHRRSLGHIADHVGHIVAFIVPLGIGSDRSVVRHDLHRNPLREVCYRRGHHVLRREISRLFKAYPLPVMDSDHGVIESSGGLNRQRPLFTVEAEGAVQVCIRRDANLRDGIPMLGKLLGFIGRKPGKVRLVIGIGAGHELGILAVGIGQGVFPGF